MDPVTMVLTSIGSAVGGGALAGAAIVGGTVATAASVSAANKATRATQAAAAEQRQAAVVQANRERRQSIRSMLIARSRAVNTANVAGLQGSSAAGGGIGSISSQFGTNLGFGSQMSGLSQNIFNYQQSALGYQGRSDMFGALGSLAFKSAPYLDGLQFNVGKEGSLFGGNSWG